ncbi:hypothetical protein F8W37_20300 [Salmonella enterica]|nr:hypothetical protein [Salmonella enterica subsp. enterica serovar Give]ECZ6314556.1 hypothetical protein [Salmonella enterica]
MTLALNSFIQMKPDNIPVRVMVLSDKVETLTWQDRLLRKLGKLPGLGSQEFMMAQKRNDRLAWKKFGEAFCREYRTDYKQFTDCCRSLGVENEPLTPLTARRIIRTHERFCYGRRHTEAATQTGDNIQVSSRGSGTCNAVYNKAESPEQTLSPDSDKELADALNYLDECINSGLRGREMSENDGPWKRTENGIEFNSDFLI